MKTNRILLTISIMAMLAVLLPVGATFAKAETSSGDSVENGKIETETVKQENNQEDNKIENSVGDRAENDASETGTLKKENSEGENEAELHRSAVSSYVKSLLEVADKNNGGIGEEVRVIAKEEEDAKDKVAQAVEEVKNRNWFKTFLIGTDYKNLGMIRSEIVKTQNRLDKLNRLLEATTTSTVPTSTTEKIQNLTQAQTKLEDFLKQNEEKFSLFGWFVRLFNN